MRVGRLEQGWEVLNDELRLPMDGLSLASDHSQEVLKHRARALASIASRHFYDGEPYVAARALSYLGCLGTVVAESPVALGDLDLPWAKLVTAATVCADTVSKKGWEAKHKDARISLPSDFTDLVWDAMSQFPCPRDDEECYIEDYIAATPK